jgi:cystathionine beta-lyase family protein involved in aluminum resistance
MIKNFISDIINSADCVVASTGDAVDKIVSISNPLAKRENESSEDYQIRLQHLERQQERKLQFKSDQQQLKQETKQARITGRTEERKAQRQAKLEQQQLKQKVNLP